MGVERAVTRWYARRQVVQREIKALQARLEPHAAEELSSLERADIERQLAERRVHLLELGPCPKPMMG